MAQAKLVRQKEEERPFLTLTLTEREVRTLGALLGHTLPGNKQIEAVVEAIGNALGNEDWQFVYNDFEAVTFYENYHIRGHREAEDLTIKVEEINNG